MMKNIPYLLLITLVAISCSQSQEVSSRASDKIKPNTTHVIAHRGAWKNTNHPENSIPALKAAIDLQCYGSEMDVHMTADGYLVVNHDPHFNKIDIQNSNLVDLRKFKLSNGDELPLLSDFLQVIRKQNKTKLIVEIKPSIRGKEWALATTKKVTDEIKKFHAGSHVEYISFDLDICKEVLKYVPKATVQYLNGDKTPAEIKDAGLSGLDYHYSVFQQHPDYFAESKKLGLVTNVWTVNDPLVMDWMIAHNVNFITTNEPELLFGKIKLAGNVSRYKEVRNRWYYNPEQFYNNIITNNVDIKEEKQYNLLPLNKIHQAIILTI
jgi:glycerophosphoryl diester phosphodiesterase